MECPQVGCGGVFRQITSNWFQTCRLRIALYGCLTPKSPQTVSISYPPNLKPPIPHPIARNLMLYLNHWHSLELRHSGGFCGAPVRILHPLWQGQVRDAENLAKPITQRVCAFAFVRVCMHMCVCAHVFTCVFGHLYMCACVYMCNLCVYMCTCVCASVSVCVRLCLYVCVRCVCVCVLVCVPSCLTAAIVVWRCAGAAYTEVGVRMCCCCCSLSDERAGASMVPGLATMSELCFNTQCAASTCTVRSMPRKQSKPTWTTF